MCDAKGLIQLAQDRNAVNGAEADDNTDGAVVTVEKPLSIVGRINNGEFFGAHGVSSVSLFQWNDATGLNTTPYSASPLS